MIVSRLSKTLCAVCAALVLAMAFVAFAHKVAALSNEPVLPPQALTIEDVRALFNFALP
jgi:hypothetical protein